MDDEDDEIYCPSCRLTVIAPYILCKQCPEPVRICLQCFSKGTEFGSHESDHAYTVVREDFPVFENSWTAAEEVSLLKIMSDCGYGNWLDVAQRMRVRGKNEIEKHYNKCYINQPHYLLPQFPEEDLKIHPNPVVFKLSDDPPRYAESSHIFQMMGGYMAGRGDFNVEYDNFMELELKNIDFTDNGDSQKDELEDRLKMDVLDVYQNCIKERWRRKHIVRRYGLINIRKHGLYNGMYSTVYSKFKDLVEKLRPFMKLCNPIGYDKFIQTMHYEYELKKSISKLKEYRENGITRERGIKIYRILKSRRVEMATKHHLLDDILVHMKDENACQTWLQRQAVLEGMSKGIASVPLPAAPRRAAPPMDIVGLPGYDKLSKKEQDLCAGVRLVPEAYIEFKDILIGECRRHGYLRLQQARTLIKIDVNKTRKVYDFLVSEGLINKEPLKFS